MSLANDLTRTLAFVVVAVVGVTAAAVTHYVQQPKEVQGFEQVGEPFYPDFDNPNEAKSLRVVDYDEDTATVRQFRVEFKDGLWRIPTHHDYPADAEDQLAETAASVIGIRREALVTRRESAHEQYNVIDPLTEEAGSLKGRGERIILKAEDGSTLADFIIGKPVPDRDGYYYVRRPDGSDEDAVYMAQLDIDLSTKFEDWIEQDLLKVDRFDLRELAVIRPSFDDQGRIIVGDDKVLRLKKEAGSGGPRGAGGSGDWQLVGLDDDSKELDDDTVRDMTRALDDLRIIGVRPKPKGITADLSLDVPSDVAGNPMQLQAFQQSRLRDLMRRGFVIAFDQNDEARLYSREGEVTAATSEGVVYHLHFGDLVTGSQEDIQIGGASDGDGESEEKSEEEQPEDGKSGESAEDGSGQDADGEEEAEDGEDEGTKPGRYLFVRAEFDASHLGEKPQKPAKPEALKKAESEEGENKTQSGSSPESKESDSAEEDQQNNDQQESPAEADGDDQAGSDSQTEAESSGKDEGDKQEGDDKEAEPDLDKLRQEYQQKVAQYENDLSEYEDKVEEGEKKVEELNRRFGNWYYVIAAEHFDKLSVSRDDLVKEKEKEEEEDGDSPSTGFPESDADDEPATKTDEPSQAGESSGQKKPGDDKQPAETQTPSNDQSSGDGESKSDTPAESDAGGASPPSDKQPSQTANEANGA